MRHLDVPMKCMYTNCMRNSVERFLRPLYTLHVAYFTRSSCSPRSLDTRDSVHSWNTLTRPERKARCATGPSADFGRTRRERTSRRAPALAATLAVTPEIQQLYILGC